MNFLCAFCYIHHRQALSLKCYTHTRMWADAQRDGHPAECTWRLLLNVVDQIAKITNAKMRNTFAGVPQTRQPISAVSGPKFTIL